MQNQIVYKLLLRYTSILMLQKTKLLFEKGRADSLECLFKKKVGKFNGWINYTLLKTGSKDNDNNYSIAEMNVS